ncbi:MAG: hypothetical protein LBJ72_12310 [Dysgonamonadaceae bacterium]|nr:hypothetical protein [Dysgonamonadaceae bacterium]
MIKKFPLNRYLIAVIIFMISSCSKDEMNGYDPPVLKIGFEDTADIVIDNKEKNPNGGPDSTYVRIIKLVSDNSNDIVSFSCYFNLVNTVTQESDETAVNTYIRLMNPIMRKDSINKDGTHFNVWDCSRAVFARSQTSTAIMIRTIDYVENVPKTSGTPSSYTFLLKILPDRSNPVKYTVDPEMNMKKVTVVDGKQLITNP